MWFTRICTPMQDVDAINLVNQHGSEGVLYQVGPYDALDRAALSHTAAPHACLRAVTVIVSLLARRRLSRKRTALPSPPLASA
jgi:hypothetical protein